MSRRKWFRRYGQWKASYGEKFTFQLMFQSTLDTVYLTWWFFHSACLSDLPACLNHFEKSEILESRIHASLVCTVCWPLGQWRLPYFCFVTRSSKRNNIWYWPALSSVSAHVNIVLWVTERTVLTLITEEPRETVTLVITKVMFSPTFTWIR